MIYRIESFDYIYEQSIRSWNQDYLDVDGRYSDEFHAATREHDIEIRNSTGWISIKSELGAVLHINTHRQQYDDDGDDDDEDDDYADDDIVPTFDPKAPLETLLKNAGIFTPESWREHCRRYHEYY
jgi:hypothetical protein